MIQDIIGYGCAVVWVIVLVAYGIWYKKSEIKEDDQKN